IKCIKTPSASGAMVIQYSIRQPNSGIIQPDSRVITSEPKVKPVMSVANTVVRYLVGTYSDIKVLQAIYKQPKPRHESVRKIANSEQHWTKPEKADSREKVKVAITTTRTRPNRSQSHPPTTPPIPIPNKDQLPNAPACIELKPHSAFKLVRLKAK